MPSQFLRDFLTCETSGIEVELVEAKEARAVAICSGSVRQMNMRDEWPVRTVWSVPDKLAPSTRSSLGEAYFNLDFTDGEGAVVRIDLSSQRRQGELLVAILVRELPARVT